MSKKEEKRRPISFSVFDPKNSIIKHNKNEKAKVRVIHCELEDCPLRDKGQCICSQLFKGSCVYGTRKTLTGYTPRAQKYYKWIKEKKDEYGHLPRLKSPSEKIAFIGEHVYLPYSHMTLCKDVPFKKHGNKLSGNGTPFINKEDWTIETIKTLINFRPKSIMYHEIKSYQKEIVPKFLQHLTEEDPEMWEKLSEENPELEERVPDYIGRKAKLHTLNNPIEWTTSKQEDEKYRVTWHWDGEELTTTDKAAYNSTWGSISLDDFQIIATPKKDAVITVRDNSWVNDETEFVD